VQQVIWGLKIVKALQHKDAEIRVVIRLNSDPKKIKELERLGVQLYTIHSWTVAELLTPCKDVTCVVSALAGLREVIIDAQKVLLDAAIEAGVARFIPSDYSSDFTNLEVGKNRNFDLRREFHQYLDKAPIKATTIFNGAFMDLLTTDMPLILFKQKLILCWGNPNQLIEFTTTYNVAEYTAETAVEDHTPRYLRIAGDTLSCNDFVKLLTELTSNKFNLFRPGGITLLTVIINLTRFFSHSTKELYPAWQGMQYMRDMMEGKIQFQTYDNNRSSNIKWTSVKEFLIQKEVGV
jgi:hypothetical protein